MKATLIAIAAAGVLATGAAAAAPLMEVQYYAQDQARPYAQDQARPYAQDQARPEHRGPDNWYDRNASIDNREASIAERIQRGHSAGLITDREARRLHRELNSIENKERQYKSDGRLSRRETDALNQDLNRLADHVRQQMRDDERR